MQLEGLDREGVNDSNLETGAHQQQQVIHDEQVNLKQHLLNSGLSPRAFTKIADDVASGDMNANMLTVCGDDELNRIANGYKFSWLQKEAFIAGAKLLRKNNSNNDSNDSNVDSHEDSQLSQIIHVYVSPEEQLILNEISQLKQLLTDYTSVCKQTKLQNNDILKAEISTLEAFRVSIKDAFDNTIDEWINQCSNEIEADEKKFTILAKEINNKRKCLNDLESDFKYYLNEKNSNNNNNNNNNNKHNNKNNNNNTDNDNTDNCDIDAISANVSKTKTMMNQLFDGDGILSITVFNEISANWDLLTNDIFNKLINDKFSLQRKKNSYKKENKRVQTEQEPKSRPRASSTIVSDDDIKEAPYRISSTSFSQSSRKQKGLELESKEETTSADSSKCNSIQWRFDFNYDYLNTGSKVHGIENNGKRIKCNYDGYCHCFSSICNNGMSWNSGIYSIKLRIDKIDNDLKSWGNIVGITSDNFCTIASLSSNNINSNSKEEGKFNWVQDCNNWIGWSASHLKKDNVLPNGLYCGWNADTRRKNIFRRSEFKYKSRNDKYQERLPAYESGDIIVLTYNSDLGELSFQLFKKKKKKKKSGLFGNSHNNEEESSLDSYIYDLPRDLTFYWFFGHYCKPVSLTILD